MSHKNTKDSGDVATVDKTKQRRTIKVEKQQLPVTPDSHASARDVKHVKSVDAAKVMLLNVTDTLLKSSNKRA